MFTLWLSSGNCTDMNRFCLYAHIWRWPYTPCGLVFTSKHKGRSLHGHCTCMPSVHVWWGRWWVTMTFTTWWGHWWVTISEYNIHNIPPCFIKLMFHIRNLQPPEERLGSVINLSAPIGDVTFEVSIKRNSKTLKFLILQCWAWDAVGKQSNSQSFIASAKTTHFGRVLN